MSSVHTDLTGTNFTSSSAIKAMWISKPSWTNGSVFTISTLTWLLP